MELSLDRLTKQYGRKIAVDCVSATLKPGVYGLLGANGAGKTTLMLGKSTLFNCLSNAKAQAANFHTVADKIQHKITGVIRNLRNIAEDLLEPLVQEPLVGILLHLDEIGHLHDLVDPPEAHAGIVAKLNRFHFHHRLITPFFFYPHGYWFVLFGEK